MNRRMFLAQLAGLGALPSIQAIGSTAVPLSLYCGCRGPRCLELVCHTDRDDFSFVMDIRTLPAGFTKTLIFLPNPSVHSIEVNSTDVILHCSCPGSPQLVCRGYDAGEVVKLHMPNSGTSQVHPLFLMSEFHVMQTETVLS